MRPLLYRYLVPSSHPCLSNACRAPLAGQLVRLSDGPCIMGFDSSPNIAVRGATLEQLVEQPVLVGWNNDRHIGCLSTAAAARRDRANLTLRIGRAGFGSHQRLLITFHLPVNTRATQRKSEKNMYLVVPAERLHLDVDVVDFDKLPPTTRAQLRNNCLEDIENGLVHARFSLETAAYVVMPKLRRPLARPLTGAPARLMSSLRALSEAKQFDVYLSPRGYVEHRLQKIRSTLYQHLIETPDLDMHATFGGGYGGGKNIWESYPCVEDGESAWNPLADDTYCEDVPAEKVELVKEHPIQPSFETLGRRVVPWPPDGNTPPAETTSMFWKPEPSKIKKLLLAEKHPIQPSYETLNRRVVSWTPPERNRRSTETPSTFWKSEPSRIKKLFSQPFASTPSQPPTPSIPGHKRRVLSDGAILSKPEPRAPPHREPLPDLPPLPPLYKSTTAESANTSATRPPPITLPAGSHRFGNEKSTLPANPPANRPPQITLPAGAHRFGDEKAILSAYSTPTPSRHHRLPPAPPPHHADPKDAPNPSTTNTLPATPQSPCDHASASHLRAAVLACLESRRATSPSPPSSSPSSSLLHTPHLFLELQEFLTAAAPLSPHFHESHRAQLLALGAAAREGRTADFDAGMRDCQRRLLAEAWRQWPPAENLLEEGYGVLEWLNGRVCRNAGTVMMGLLVGLRGAAQGVGMGGEGGWREAVAEVRAVAFWAFG